METSKIHYNFEKTADLLKAYQNSDPKHDWFAGQNLLSAALFGQFFYETNFRYKTVSNKNYLLVFTSNKLAHRVLKDDFDLSFPIVEEVRLDQAVKVAVREKLDGIIIDRSQIDFNLTVEEFKNVVVERIKILDQSLKNEQLLKKYQINEDDPIEGEVAEQIKFIVPGRFFLDDEKKPHHSYIALHNSSNQTKWISIFTSLGKLKNWSQAPFAGNFFDDDISVFLMTKTDLLESERLGDFRLSNEIFANGVVIDAPTRKGMGQIVELKEEN
ncbi:hypothetical protein [Oenococcus oeni]|uniref:hypothetical protein n=1 Tax=Oenococcus oeni TaxID=1247 RepID=UPI0010B1E031|nr:hypothetical protein [Oenococcus oeni]SYW15453.1 conserved hypothetical protein [Oenococcus oeni]